jgi:hypothetical protein
MVARGIGILVFGAVMLLACLFTGASAGDWQTETARQLEQQLQSPLVGDTPSCPDRHFDSYRAVVRFYATRDYEPAWVDQFGLLPEGAMALAVVKQAGNQGLRYADYRNPWLDDLLDGVTTRPVIIGPTFNGKQVQLDLVVTEMVLRYAWHRTMGRIDPMMIYGVTTEKEPARDLAVALAESLESGRLDVFLRNWDRSMRLTGRCKKACPDTRESKRPGAGRPSMTVHRWNMASAACGWRSYGTVWASPGMSMTLPS